MLYNIQEVSMKDSKNTEERKQEFVDAAEKLFKENGIMDTTVNNIVKELDVAKGLFYYYFKSKDDVIDAISQKYSDAFNQSMMKDMSSTDWKQQVDQFIDNCIQSFADMDAKLKGKRDDVDLSALSSRSVHEAKQASSRALRKLLEEGNRIKKTAICDADYYADLITGGIAYMVSKGDRDAEKIKEIVWDLINRSGKDENNE